MKKTITLGILALTLISGTVFAKENENSPFEQIWNAITDLQEQIDAIELTPGPKGDTGPRGPAGGSLHLYDANDQDLGVFMGHDLYKNGYTFTTYNQEIELPLSFFSSAAWGPAILQVSGGDVVKFTGLNCTGTAFTENQTFPFQTLWRINERNEQNNQVSRYFTSSHYTSSGEEMIALSTLANDECVDVIDPLPSTGFTLIEVDLPFSEPIEWPLHIN